MDPLSLYLHIPFCTVKCPYCDFNTYSRMEGLIHTYLEAIKKELSLWGPEVRDTYQVQTIYFGGGTPSLLTIDQVSSVLETCHKRFHVAEDAEVSLEANPENVTLDHMQGLLQVGVNRLSMGAQSFDAAELKWLGRTHGSETIVNAYNRVREAGFKNISLDLMYGLTDQSIDTWEHTLRKAIELRPDHLSLYALTIEEGTPFGKQAARGLLKQPDADEAADMYLLSEKALKAEGYNHYEISNWELDGPACRHNTTYWEDRYYIGFGPGAHSYFGGYRFSDIRSPRRYIDKVDRLSKSKMLDLSPDLIGVSARDLSVEYSTFEKNKGEVSIEETIRRLSPVDMIEDIDKATEMMETVVLGLRLTRGVSKASFRAKFGSGVEDVYGEAIDELKGLALLEESGDNLRLTPRGRLLSNEAFVRFL